jgi:hypothetical protein
MLTSVDARKSARDRLLELFNITLSATSCMDPTSILSIQEYDSSALKDLLDAAHSSGADKYHQYLARRKSGSPRELFPTVQHAHVWLRLAACVKYVDGSWVSGILLQPSEKERKSAKIAWQVISEEFGDGDIEKNHVFIYHQLIDQLGLGRRDGRGSAMRGDQPDFDGSSVKRGVPRCWSAAVAQQSIGLLAAEYFPESLGFNMAYETLPYHLLVTSHELRELNIDDSYFALHITIDNPHSGHAAMARLAVESYLSQLKGDSQKVAWRRVQAGMVLAEGLPTTPWSPIEFDKSGDQYRPKETAQAPSPAEVDVAHLFLEKSTAARRMHCPCRLRVAGQTLEEWLDPATMTLPRSIDFVRALSSFRPLVRAGDFKGSRLVTEMEWGGRMFGAFSRSEVALVKAWIAGVSPQSVRSDLYSAFAQRSPDHSDLASQSARTAALDCDASMARIAPTWFASLLLLDHFPLSPPRLASPLGMSVLRVIRAQLGYPALHRRNDICAGLDDFGGGKEVMGLWEIGEGIFGCAISVAEAIDLMPRDVRSLLSLRSQPYRNQALLVGLSMGFLGLHRHPSIAESIQPRHSPILDRIESEQREALQECIERCSSKGVWRNDCERGLVLARDILSRTSASDMSSI